MFLPAAAARSADETRDCLGLFVATEECVEEAPLTSSFNIFSSNFVLALKASFKRESQTSGHIK